MRRFKYLAAFAAVYFIWGSTYLAIRIAIDSIPPFWMAAARFLVSGSVLYALARWRGAARPTRAQARSAAIVGTLLLLGGNGFVAWAELHVPTGIASLLIATVPLWMVLFDWRWNKTPRPSAAVAIGIVTGLAGIWLLTGTSKGETPIHPFGTAVLLFASILWAAGSVYARRAALPSSAILSTGLQMLFGGAALFLTGCLLGEPARFDASRVTPASAAALGYLIVFGSFCGFTAYVWLLKNAPPARVATYAYVNPVVAVFLGWVFLGEALAPRTLAASGVILLAVVLIVSAAAPKPGARTKT